MAMYYAQFEPAAEGGFVITFPDFGWGGSQADDESTAAAVAVDLLETLISSDMKDGQALPAPSVRRGRKFRAVALPALSAAKVELYNAFRASGITKAELARRCGISKTNVDRLFDLLHASRLDQIESAFHALGRRLVIGVEAA